MNFTSSFAEISTAIVDVCRALNAKGYLAAADGNVSYRISDEEILITPAGLNKARMRPEDMAVITLDNRIVRGKPSTERLMHLAVFQACPKAKVVVHAHPPTAIAWTIARPDLKELPAGSLSELILALGAVPIVPYARPGTATMGDVLKPHLPQRRGFILARHGALSWGEDVEEAFNGMERIEHTAVILKSAQELGGITELPAEEIAVLREMRAKIGERSL